MLTVTGSASAQFAQMLADTKAPGDAVIRIVVREDGLALGLDTTHPEDAAFDHEDRTVLVLDAEVSQLLEEKTLDVEDTEEGPQLAIN